ncbi:MAG: GNAT family N-acetyltransferase [Actinobacteria bacterium]|nr:GNAT family N-acetyltransferase [Actinomycetota bacterium]
MAPRPAVILEGERVALVAPAREAFVERWPELNDPSLGVALGAGTSALSPSARVMPPVTREHREAVYEAHVNREILAFELWVREDGRCVGEAYLAGISWPRGGADLTVAVYAPDDRGRGLGSEGAALLCAYAFDGLGLNRLSARFGRENAPAAQAVRSSGTGYGWREVGYERGAQWGFGRRLDVEVWELLRGDFPPHPATEALREPVTTAPAGA